MADDFPDKTERTPVEPRQDDQTLIRSIDGEETTPHRQGKVEPPYLVIVEGPRVGLRYPLPAGSHVIGRAIGMAIRLDDQSVSRQHAELTRADTGWSIKDLGSKNGTYVNGTLITDTVVVGHKDIIKVGIYTARLITQEISIGEEMAIPPQYISPDRTQFVSAAPDTPTDQIAGAPADAALEDRSTIMPPPIEEKSDHAAKRRRRMIIWIGAATFILAVAVLGAARFFTKSSFDPGSLLTKPAERPPDEPAPPALPPAEAPPLSAEQAVPPPVEGDVAAPEAAPPPPPSPGEPTAPVPQEGEVAAASAAPQAVPEGPQIPVFLDFVSSPLPAAIVFQEKELGKTPLRVNVELAPGQTYAVTARFQMPEIKEEYTQQQQFTVDPTKAVVPLLFRAPIGIVRIDALPRDVQVYIEGKFDYDRFRDRSIKLEEVVLQKPIYAPYGEYAFELRRARQLSESSQTFVQDIIYRRSFKLMSEAPTFFVSVNDQDLSVFPVDIRSKPSNADVFIDGQAVGKTPYRGVFPLGEHRLSLRKEGYFEHTETLKVDINTPFSTEVEMKTSVAGAHINNARAALNRAMFQEAINALAEALAGTPAPSEAALANLLLGRAYLGAGDPSRALGYFQKAAEHEEHKQLATLGIVNVHALQGKTNEALPLLVDVLLKAQAEEVKREANVLFQKISPFRSVIYVYSEPPGAAVVINDKPVAQKTPVILHELPLGSYRLHIEKAGFLPADLNLTLTVNEFNPVIVKLKPLPQ